MEELLRACAESSPVKHAILLDHLKHGDTICDTAERLGLSHECAHVHMFHLRQKVRSEFGVAWGYMTQSEANGARDTKRSRRK
jgi:hypothetical protein